MNYKVVGGSLTKDDSIYLLQVYIKGWIPHLPQEWNVRYLHGVQGKETCITITWTDNVQRNKTDS
jgi:hypothetical protein